MVETGGAATPPTEELLLTVSAAHAVIRIERYGTDGKPRELTPHDWATLTTDEELAELSAAVAQAYLAGLAVGLGEEESEAEEVDEDLVRLQLLVDRPFGRQLLGRTASLHGLSRVLLRRLLRRRGHPAESAAQQRRQPIANGARNGSASTP